MNKTIDLKFYGANLTVNGYYEKGEMSTRDNPGYPRTFEVYSVYAGGEDITRLISEDFIDELETKILDYV